MEVAAAVAEAVDDEKERKKENENVKRIENVIGIGRGIGREKGIEIGGIGKIDEFRSERRGGLRMSISSFM